MLEVHPPHESISGWKSFLLHLLTITVGLLIALSLEGTVEWFHHRHLVHEAEASLFVEISNNEKSLQRTAADIHKEQDSLKHDVMVLKEFLRNHKMPNNEHMEITFHLSGFDEVSWKTAQSTGALAYMRYNEAQQYSNIYETQSRIDTAEDQAARDTIISLAPFMNQAKDDPDPTLEQAETIKAHIEVLQGQLQLLDSLVEALDREYKEFLDKHHSH